jgi:hypothetical protein
MCRLGVFQVLRALPISTLNAMNPLRSILFSLTLLLLGSCASAMDIALAGNVVVEVDAYSGRPNPTWTLTADEAVEAQRRLRDLPIAAGARMPEAVLGYRGFRLREGAASPGTGRRIYVTSGLVQIEDQGEPLYRDVHGLESWLRELARRAGHDSVLPDDRHRPASAITKP